MKNLSGKEAMTLMFAGGLIGLAVISVFVFSVDNPKPEWAENWRLRPLIVTPIVTAFGMLSFFLMDIVKPKRSEYKVVIFLLSFMGFFISLWLGTILGLVGTLWD